MRLIDADKLCENLLERWSIADTKKEELIRLIMADIVTPIVISQPIIEPESQWIPCSERLQEEKDAGILKKLGTSKRSNHVLITVDVKGDRMTDVGCTYDGVWHWDKKYAFPDWKVVAWMPLPEPWRGDAE